MSILFSMHYFTYMWLFILGAAFGSFMNVLVDRLHRNETIQGRSHCENCNTTLRWFEVIPVISYIIIRGKCITCKTNIPVRLPIVEVLAGILVVLPVLLLGISSNTILIAFVGLIFLYIALWDYLYMEIPTEGIVLLWVAGLLLNGFYAPLYMLSGIPVTSLLLITYVVSRGKGLGFGDVLFTFAVSSLMSFPFLFLGLYVAILFGGIVAALLLIFYKATRNSHIPFGPFLSIGFYSMLIYSFILQ